MKLFGIRHFQDQRHNNNKKDHASAPYREAGKNSILFQFVITQIKSPRYNEKVSQVLKDLEEIKLEIEVKDCETMQKGIYKELVMNDIYQFAFAQRIEQKKIKKNQNLQKADKLGVKNLNCKSIQKKLSVTYLQKRKSGSSNAERRALA